MSFNQDRQTYDPRDQPQSLFEALPILTGQRREGRYVGLWSIAKKLSAALGIGLLLLVNTGDSPNRTNPR